MSEVGSENLPSRPFVKQLKEMRVMGKPREFWLAEEIKTGKFLCLDADSLPDLLKQNTKGVLVREVIPGSVTLTRAQVDNFLDVLDDYRMDLVEHRSHTRQNKLDELIDKLFGPSADDGSGDASR